MRSDLKNSTPSPWKRRKITSSATFCATGVRGLSLTCETTLTVENHYEIDSRFFYFYLGMHLFRHQLDHYYFCLVHQRKAQLLD